MQMFFNTVVYSGQNHFTKVRYERNECNRPIIEYTFVKNIIHDVDGQQNS